MKIGVTLLLFSFAAPIAFAKAESTDDLGAILHDPFQKPVFLQSPAKPKTDDELNKASWMPHLIMTLRAGRHSMANVGGQIVRLGEVIDGYKLIEVYERAVVFVNQGEITRLTLDEDNLEENKAIHETL